MVTDVVRPPASPPLQWSRKAVTTVSSSPQIRDTSDFEMPSTPSDGAWMRFLEKARRHESAHRSPQRVVLQRIRDLIEQGDSYLSSLAISYVPKRAITA
jgi:hypothetical protein